MTLPTTTNHGLRRRGTSTLLCVLGALPLVELGLFGHAWPLRLPALLLLSLILASPWSRRAKLWLPAAWASSIFLATIGLGSSRGLVTLVMLLGAFLMVLGAVVERRGAAQQAA